MHGQRTACCPKKEASPLTTLKALKPGQSARIHTVGGEGALRQHFLDMGVIPGVQVTVIKLAPMGDPMELRIRGYELTLRLSEAEKITVIPLSAPEAPASSSARVPLHF